MKDESMIRVLVVDDEKGVCDFLSIMLKKEGYAPYVTQDPTKVLKILEEWGPQIILIDIRMPEIDGLSLLSQVKEHSPFIIVILITAYASVESVVEAMRRGAFDYITKPFKLDEVRLVLKRAAEVCKLREENIRLTQTIKELKMREELIGKSKPFIDIIELVHKIASTDSTVLIQGESGTGKELIAREIHKLSPRSDKPFIAINCGALPETLLESELFGYVKGAFTGAVKDKEGLFKSAHLGTLFLDEISAASPKIQVGLLRVLEQKEIIPVGSSAVIKVDVRLIAATNKNLEMMVREEKFREDLYYRINVIPIRVPPLRERKEDIPLLVRHFLKKYAEKYKMQEKKVSKTAMTLLLNYTWPGNVRELENVIERIVVVEESSFIEADALPDKIKESALYAPIDKTGRIEPSIAPTIVAPSPDREGLSERQTQILAYLSTHPKITSKICSSLFGRTQRTVRKDLTELVNKKLLLRKGTSKKNTYYIRREG